jgi:plastocyanin
MRGATAWVIMAATLACAPAALGAQAAVSGQVTLLEKSNKPSKDLANAVVYLVPETPPRKPAPAMHVTVSMHGREFTPHVNVVTAGSSVRFANDDPFRHNAFSNSPLGSFDFGIADRGTSSQEVLKKPGVYPVFCDIHAQMAAYIVVVETRWFTLAGVDGHFAIDSVPPGDYVLHAWHERGGEVTEPVTVAADGLGGVHVQIDVRGYRKLAHKNKAGEDYYSSQGEVY